MSLISIGSMTVDGRSRSLNAQRLINCYAEKAPMGSQSELVIRSSPGLATFATVGTGPIRGMHVMGGVLFVVTGNDLYSIDSGGAGTLRGAAATIAGTGAVQMASNLIGELVIVNSSGTGWVWDGSLLQSISSLDADFGNDAISVTFLDQFMVYGRINSGQVFASDLNNAKSYDALSFATAEFADDDVTEVYSHAGLLWVFGEKTTERWYNAGTIPFAFLRIGGSVLTSIGGTRGTVADVDEALYWHSPDGFVYQAVGFNPRRISTEAIENRIAGWTNLQGFTYKQEGHAFYLLSATEGCVVYDAATELWHENQTFNIPRWRASSYARVYNKHLVGDYLIGRVYEMSLENFADGTIALQRKIIIPPIHNNGLRVSMSEAQVVFEHGVGLTSGQGSDPQVILDYSDDGGQSYKNERWAGIGKIGEYQKRAIWRRLGSFRLRNYRLTYSEPTPFTIYGARV